MELWRLLAHLHRFTLEPEATLVEARAHERRGACPERDVTWSILHRVLLDPRVLLTMIAHGIGPEDVEAKVTELLEYLERTREKRAGDG